MNVAKYKRKNVTAREPNGQPQRTRSMAPSNAKRIRDEAVRKSHQSEYGSELGRLWLDDKITASMYEAGKKWLVVAVANSIALQSPSANPRSLGIGSGGESHPVDPDSPQGEREAKYHRKAVLTYQSAISSIPNSSHRTIETVVERGLALCGHQELLDFRCGLLILANHWHLTDSRKSA